MGRGSLSIIFVALILLGATLALVFSSDVSLFEPSGENVKGANLMYLGTVPLNVEIADSDEERRQGLSDREQLPQGHGMLFVFDEPGRWSIWMQNMRFPIDALWLDEEARVVWVEHTLTPETYPRTFGPPTDVRYVVETEAGLARTFDIGVGTRAVLPAGVEP